MTRSVTTKYLSLLTQHGESVAQVLASPMLEVTNTYDRSVALVIDASDVYPLLKVLRGDDDIDGNDRAILLNMAVDIETANLNPAAEEI